MGFFCRGKKSRDVVVDDWVRFFTSVLPEFSYSLQYGLAVTGKRLGNDAITVDWPNQLYKISSK